jgi:hypothetical protein
MKHIKLFEHWQHTHLNPLKDTFEYEIITNSGFTDVTTPQGGAMGNIRFSHPSLGSDTVRINKNGNIFMDSPSGKSFIVIRKDIPNTPLTSTQEYANKLLYLYKLLPKISDASDLINKKVEEDPSSIRPNVLKWAIEKGLLKNPSEFTGSIANVGSYGFFD